MKKLIKYFENTIVIALISILAIIIAISTYELAVMIILNIKSKTGSSNLIFLDINELFAIFSFILFIVIGLELFETIKIFLQKHIIPAETILLVALTAIARKIIVLDYDKYQPLTLIGIAAIVLALSLGYYFLRISDRKEKKKKEELK